MREEILYKLPEGWKKEKLGSDDFKIRGSGIERFEGEKDYLSTESIQGTKIEKIESKISYKKRPSRANMQPVLNSIWFAKMKGTTKVYCFDETNKSELNKYILSTGFTGINPLNCEAKFLKYFFLSPNFNLQKDNFSTGTTQVAINNDGIKKIEIIYPESKEEQILIVQEIEKEFAHLDAAVKSLKSVKNKLEVYRKSVLKAAFEGNWKFDKLGSIFKTTSGGTPSRSKKEYYTGDIRWLKSGELNDNQYIDDSEEHITKEAIKNSSAKIFLKDTVLIALYGATTGKLGIIKKECATNQAICGIFPNSNYEPEFIYYYLLFKREQLVSQTKGGAQPNISQGVVRDIEFPKVDKEVQLDILNIIESRFSVIDKLEETVDNALIKAEQLRKSILKSAFEGKLVKHDGCDKNE